MTTTALSPTVEPEIVCPSWCSGAEHLISRDSRTHIADQGIWHHSEEIDRWTGVHPDGNEPLVVRIVGYRHDYPGHPDGPDLSEWYDEVEVSGDVNPGFMSSISLPAVDARRLGLALIAAANKMEAQA